MRLIWTEPSSDDLDEIEAYISEDNSPTVAYDVVFNIFDTAERVLSEYPESGRKGRMKNTLELVIDGLPYLVIYRVKEYVEVLRVIHGAQVWPPEDA